MLVRAVIAFLVLPGTVAYLVPILIGPGRTGGGAWAAGGALSIAIGSALLLWCTRDFYVAGKGTLAPWTAPAQLVTAGPYAVSRNPMYVAVVTVLCGWSLWYASWVLALYTVAVAVAFHLRILLYEEPRLDETFGQAWQVYRAAVPRWLMK
jgi:protein-S-isoprenylcysteine O-methyltransferase Ste14